MGNGLSTPGSTASTPRPGIHRPCPPLHLPRRPEASVLPRVGLGRSPPAPFLPPARRAGPRYEPAGPALRRAPARRAPTAQASLLPPRGTGLGPFRRDPGPAPPQPAAGSVRQPPPPASTAARGRCPPSPCHHLLPRRPQGGLGPSTGEGNDGGLLELPLPPPGSLTWRYRRCCSCRRPAAPLPSCPGRALPGHRSDPAAAGGWRQLKGLAAGQRPEGGLGRAAAEPGQVGREGE
ncbi:basic proline-rich protein-like [Indicator indicator]|uniref:basic proline-rich protein-like n=1 Tax=Indicator indicator TaxID=1002788 RepID=UPI0023E00F73|nr:basic proline-rich protein-like [Indicator indicator]